MIANGLEGMDALNARTRIELSNFLQLQVQGRKCRMAAVGKLAVVVW
jgi:hypothetical protein